MAQTILWAATGDAIARISGGEVELLLEGSGARCVAVAPDGRAYAGGPRGVFRDDGDRLLEGDVFSVAVFAGGRRRLRRLRAERALAQ